MSQRKCSPKKATVSGKNLVIVGAGLSGLTAALYARAAGYDVTVLERATFVGGRCATEDVSVVKHDGEELTAAFDTGATVWTMPSLLDDALGAVGLSVADVDPSFEVAAISPSYHARFADSSSFNVFKDEAQMEDELRRFATESAAEKQTGAAVPTENGAQSGAMPLPAGDELVTNYRKLRAWLQQLFDHSFTHFMSESFDAPWDLIRSTDSIRDLTALVRLGAFGKLEPKVMSFLKDPRLARVFSFQALYAGVAPRKALAVYGCISHMDTTMGVYYPHSKRFGRGMGTIAKVLAAALERAGGAIRFGADVRGVQLSADGSKVLGLSLHDGEFIAADAMIATVDLPVIEGWLEEAGAKPTTRVVPLRYSPSAVVMHGLVPASVSENWPTRHHTISFGEKWNETFAEISAPRGGRLMSDPSLLVTRPAVSAPERIVEAADGTRWEPVSVLAPCPNLESAPLDWATLTGPYVAEVLGELASRGWTGIDCEYVVGRVDTPATWADQDMGAGSPFGLAHLFRQTGPFRPRNFAGGSGLAGRMPSNLVLAGSTTVPGVGVPTVMISGRLAAERLGTAK